MKTDYKPQSEYVNTAMNIGKSLWHMTQLFLGRYYEGNALNPRRHRTLTYLFAGGWVISKMIPGTEALENIIGAAGVAYSAPRWYKDHQARK